MGAEISDWTDNRAGLWPSMTLTADALPEVVLDVLAANLDDAGWTIKDRSASGFLARHINVLDWVSLERGLSRLVLTASAGAGGAGTEVTVKVKTGGAHKMARRRGRAGLTAAVAELERRDIAVTLTPWVHN